MQNRKIIITDDGSHSLYLPEWNEYFHSKHGAIQESLHVFIKNGLYELRKKEISILEIGFGTGLNALLSYFETLKNNQKIDYTSVEAYPIRELEFKELNYCQYINQTDCLEVFNKIFYANWNEKCNISSHFELLKIEKKFQEITDENLYDLIYFDAFGPNVQPELWIENIFQKMYSALKKDGILVTYAAKGSVRRTMQFVGFQVERLSGPPGKREMLRAKKI